MRFNRRAGAIPRRLIFVGLTLVGFTLLWINLPQTVTYWIVLPLLAALLWVASYGWRAALAVFVEFLHRLEEL
jgi:hypothetical protein